MPLIDRLRRATVGRYEVFDELGSGGMATVFRAREVALDREVAIKVMSPAITGTPGAIERFRREARVAAALSHPHIVPIHAIGEEPGLAYYVMKYIEGRSLDAILREDGSRSLDFVRNTVAVVGGALQYAHQRGVVHRDVKPANIMLDREGWTYVTDFGIAKQEDGQGLTQSGTIIGTPAYMCPEQFNGAPVTGAADQYSLGIVAFELLAGHAPFGGPSLGEVMRGHLLDPVPPVRSVRPDLPEAIEVCITRMLAKEPGGRYATLTEAVAAFESAVAVPAAPPGPRPVPITAAGEMVARDAAPTTPLPRPRPTAAATVPRRVTVRAPAPVRARATKGPSRFRRVLYAGATLALIGFVATRDRTRAAGSELANSRDSAASSERTTNPRTVASADANAAAPRASAPVPTAPSPRQRTYEAPPASPPAVSNDGAVANGDAGQAAAGRAARQRLEQMNAGRAAAGKAPLEAAMLRIGSRTPRAELFVNGRSRGQFGGRPVQNIPIGVGSVTLSIRAPGCTSWDTTFTAANAQRYNIGERSPRC